MLYLNLVAALPLIAAFPVFDHKDKSAALDFQVIKTPVATSKRRVNRLLKRSTEENTFYFLVDLDNVGIMYMADMSIGTPAQNISVDIDTGSSDLLVPAAGTVSEYGTFDAQQSNSFKNLRDDFEITYGDGRSAKGSWATETVKLGASQIDGLCFGYATDQTVEVPILGLGPKNNEASVHLDSDSFSYDNFPAKLKAQGDISILAYSIYLQQQDDKVQGQVLFGAVDETKFYGDLAVLPIVKKDIDDMDTSEITTFFVELQGLKHESGSESLLEKNYLALLDTGTTYIYAPKDIATKFSETYGTYSSEYGVYTVDCNNVDIADLVFSFAGKDIRVPGSELVIRSSTSSGDTVCFMNLISSSMDFFILGDSFLRSAYVYYDIEQGLVGIAQSKTT